MLEFGTPRPSRSPRRRKKDTDGKASDANSSRMSGSKRKAVAEPDPYSEGGPSSGERKSARDGDGADADGAEAIRESKRWRKKELSVTIDEADNCFLGEESKKSAVLVPPEDTPRRSLRLQGRAPWPGDALDSPLSVERHAEFTFDQVVGVGGAPGDTPHAVAAVCNVPSSRPSSVLYSDSLKFDFDEVCAHFPSPPGAPAASAASAVSAQSAQSASAATGRLGN